MKKEDYVAQCRWYQHRQILVDGDAKLCAFVEEWWVNAKLSVTEDNNPFSDLVTDYANAGLSDFEMTDDTPLTLKAVLFNRFTQYNERVDIEAFKEWYKNVYLR